jgi:hypothetical protein
MDSLQINTGEVRIPIVRDGVNVGEIVFNPNSALMAERYYRLIENLDSHMRQLRARAADIETRTSLDGNGLPTTALEIVAFAKEAHEAICKEYDMLFGEGTAAMVFGDFVPLTEAGFGVHTQFVNGFGKHFQTARADKLAKYAPKSKKVLK